MVFGPPGAQERLIIFVLSSSFSLSGAFNFHLSGSDLKTALSTVYLSILIVGQTEP